MATIRGVITDTTSGEPAGCTVHVLSADGRFVHPEGAVLKVGPGTPAFYCAGSFEVTVPTGGVRVLVERGTEYVPLERNLTVTETESVDLELPLQRWTHLTERGWYPGNTHIHYDEKEQQRDHRLELEGHVHDFSVTVVSVLRRWDLDYASNHFPIGVMTDLSTAHHVVDIGEENRHNFHGGQGNRGQDIGYGHVMFLRIRNLVEPVSRGMLVDSLDPDYPPICHACDEARAQDGIVLWCHNGRGLEAPVAAALGKLDGFNLFDPFRMDPEYDIWYRLLNCGIRLPASTGSDWFVCSNNRVYVDLGGAAFDYDRWIDGLRAGRTFITNGPVLLLRADGAVVRRWKRPGGVGKERIRDRIAVRSDGWIAARCYSHVRDSYAQEIFAHTSPIYLRCGSPNPAIKPDAAYFVAGIDDALERWVSHKLRYGNDRQREEVRELFKLGRAYFAAL